MSARTRPSTSVQRVAGPAAASGTSAAGSHSSSDASALGGGATAVPSRDLRNDTAGVLRRVASGETLQITRDGHPVAVLAPVPTGRPRFVSARALRARLASIDHDPSLAGDLDALELGTTDDVEL
jgi:prevent-host-death family protein